MIPYMGGKSVLSKWIIANFPNNYQNMLYCEVFGGGGWVMFRKAPSINEVYNDLYQELVNLFLVIRDRFKPFNHKVRWTMHSRVMFDLAKIEKKNPRLRDVDRALNYLTVKIQSFSSNETTYRYSIDTRHRNEWSFINDRIEKIRDRMLNVNIECLDFEKLIEKYDTPKTLFYIDPPYVDKEFYYHVPFGMKDHGRLASLLKSIKGKFALSYYPHEFIDSAYKRFRRLTHQTVKSSCGITRTSGRTTRPKATELLIMNY